VQHRFDEMLAMGVVGIRRQALRDEGRGGEGGIEDRFLRHVGGPRAWLLKALAGVDLRQSRQSAQQRRLAAAIATDQAGAIAARQRRGHAGERRPPADGDACVAYGEEGRGGHGRGTVDRELAGDR
jgi:hypothetical protein